MMDKFILADDGRTPLVCDDFRVWGQWMEGKGNRRVALDTTPHGDVSTVFLGLDHAFGGGPPMLWETMVFGGKLSGEQERYFSYDDAVAGHKEMLRRVLEAMNE